MVNIHKKQNGRRENRHFLLLLPMALLNNSPSNCSGKGNFGSNGLVAIPDMSRLSMLTLIPVLSSVEAIPIRPLPARFENCALKRVLTGLLNSSVGLQVASIKPYGILTVNNSSSLTLMIGGLYDMVPLIRESRMFTLPWYSVIFEIVANHIRPLMNSVDKRIPKK